MEKPKCVSVVLLATGSTNLANHGISMQGQRYDPKAFSKIWAEVESPRYEC